MRRRATEFDRWLRSTLRPPADAPFTHLRDALNPTWRASNHDRESGRFLSTSRRNRKDPHNMAPESNRAQPSQQKSSEQRSDGAQVIFELSSGSPSSDRHGHGANGSAIFRFLSSRRLYHVADSNLVIARKAAKHKRNLMKNGDRKYTRILFISFKKSCH